MKPDKKACLNCKKEISGRATFCSDACRMAYKRKANKPEHNSEENPNKSEQIETRTPKPEQAFRDSLTKADKTFYDRAMRDFGEPYYKFGKTEHEEKCLHCGKDFKTTLSMLRFCSYEHYADALAGKTYA